MAGSTEPMSVVELCIPGTLRICVHVENVLCLRDFYSQTLKSFSDRPHHGRHRHKRGILGCSSIVIFENNIDEAFVKVQSASVCFEIFHESLDLGKKKLLLVGGGGAVVVHFLLRVDNRLLLLLLLLLCQPIIGAYVCSCSRRKQACTLPIQCCCGIGAVSYLQFEVVAALPCCHR